MAPVKCFISYHWAPRYRRTSDHIRGSPIKEETPIYKVTTGPLTDILSRHKRTLPPERTQPQKLCTANFSSGTLKTLINRLLRLKNKIFWRAPCEKKPFFSRLKSDSQKYILKWSYWPEILAPGLKSIFVTTLFSNFFSFYPTIAELATPSKMRKRGYICLIGLKRPKTDFRGPKMASKDASWT